MERALNSPLPEDGPAGKKRTTKQASVTSRKSRHLWSKLVRIVCLVTLVACSTLAVWSMLPYQLVIVPKGPSQDLEEAIAGCGGECSRDDLLTWSRRQAREAQGREAMLRREVEAMSSKASLLPEALSKAKECQALLKQSDHACREQHRDLEAVLEQHKRIFATCAGLSDENQVAAEDRAQQAEAACKGAARKLKRWHALEQRLEEREKVLDAITGKGERCWSNLHEAQEAVRKWQLRCAAVSAACTILSGSVVAGYRRWLTRKMWRWTAEKARLGAALRLAEAGLGKGGRQRGN